MNKKTLRTGTAAALGGAVLIAGLLVGASLALADEADEPEVTAEDKSADRCRGHLRGLVGDIAEELGLDLEDLKDQRRDGATLEELADGLDLDAALESVKDRVLAELDERVDEGDLSEERADAIRERIEGFDLDELPSPREGLEHLRRGFGDMRGFGNLGFDWDLDPAELREKLESGLSLDEALGDLGVDLEEMLEDAQSAALERIDDLVADGVIGQERADEIKEMITSFEMGEFPFGPRGFHFEFDLERLDGFDFERFDDFDFDFERFRGPRGHHRGFGFFGDRSDDANAEGASFSA